MNLALTEILQIAQIVAIIGGGGLVAYRLGRSSKTTEAGQAALTTALGSQQAEITELKVEVKKLGEVLTQQRLFQEALERLEERYDELRRGVGWIVQPPQFSAAVPTNRHQAKSE